MTPRQIAAMYADPEYKEFVNSGTRLKVSKLFSMSYLLASVMNAYQEEATELMDRYHMNQKGIKMKADNLINSFNAYDKEMRKFLKEEGARKFLCEDYENLKRLCDGFMNYEDLKGENNAE